MLIFYSQVINQGNVHYTEENYNRAPPNLALLLKCNRRSFPYVWDVHTNHFWTIIFATLEFSMCLPILHNATYQCNQRRTISACPFEIVSVGLLLIFIFFTFHCFLSLHFIVLLLFYWLTTYHIHSHKINRHF